jgi:Protein of unknown function (DUF1064)
MHHKYNAKAVEIDGIKFPSKLEGDAYAYLRGIHDAGGMQNLRLQLPYALHSNGVKVCTYVLDFQCEFSDGTLEAIEAKGVMTPVARLKLKMFAAEYEIPLIVVTGNTLSILKGALYEVLSNPQAEREAAFKQWLQQQRNPKRKQKRKIKAI